MKLFDLVDKTEYLEAVKNKHIKTQVHPTAPYIIHNYTDSCTWDRVWNNSTMTCRGLITHAETGEIIARSIPKFFNWDQEEAPLLEASTRVTVVDKMDGSLGILYQMPSGIFAVATRGSFTSDQAIWATEWIDHRIDFHGWEPDSDYTYLFEIIYPENRIVVDYGDREDMTFLMKIHKETGEAVHDDVTVPTPYAYRYGLSQSWGEALGMPERHNAEGLVVEIEQTGQRVKIKYEDYKRMHRYVTGTNERNVWEALVAGKDLKAEFEGAPDEFHDWVQEVADKLDWSFGTIAREIGFEFQRVIQAFPNYTHDDRGDFARAVSKSPNRAAMFTLLDGKPINDIIWKELKPVNPKSVRLVSSDAD